MKTSGESGRRSAGKGAQPSAKWLQQDAGVSRKKFHEEWQAMWVLHQVEQLLLHRQIAQYGLDERRFGEIVFAEKLLLLKAGTSPSASDRLAAS